jgi:AraC-like DNA-binding protein
VHRLLKAHLESLARGSAASEDLVTRVRHHIKETVGSRHCNLDGICRRSGIHPRALQRALREHRLTFRQLLLDVRQELAEDYFRNSSLSVVELSELLGYRNASAFSRAFKQRTGLSPQHWKEQRPG